MTPVQRTIVDRLARGPATLAGLRSAFPEGAAEARALMSMGEDDPFGLELAALVRDGAVIDDEGRYRLAEGRGAPS